MAITDIIYKGEDRELQFTLFGPTNDPILNSSLDAMIVVLYAKETGSILEKYSKKPLTDYNSVDLVISNVNSNEFIIKLQSEVTRRAIADDLLMVEVKGRYINVDYSNNTFDVIDRNVVVAIIRDSISGVTNNMG